MKYYILSLLLLSFSNSIHAQKMNILEFFEAFKSNTLSPHNEMGDLEMNIIEENGQYKMQDFDGEEYELEVDKNLTFLKFKTPYKYHGDCYPTFKIFTKANGTQILAVTEDYFSEYMYASKYKDLDLSNEEELALMEQWKYNPFPVKFWTYNNGNWKDITFEVIPNFFSYEEMIASLNDEVVLRDDVDLATHIAQEISYFFHPIYELNPNENKIRVWVDEKLLVEYSEGKEHSEAYGLNLGRISRMKEYFYSFIDRNLTKFHTYYLVWDAQKGQFVRK